MIVRRGHKQHERANLSRRLRRLEQAERATRERVIVLEEFGEALEIRVTDNETRLLDHRNRIEALEEA